MNDLNNLILCKKNTKYPLFVWNYSSNRALLQIIFYLACRWIDGNVTFVWKTWHSVMHCLHTYIKCNSVCKHFSKVLSLKLNYSLKIFVHFNPILYKTDCVFGYLIVYFYCRVLPKAWVTHLPVLYTILREPKPSRSQDIILCIGMLCHLYTFESHSNFSSLK